MNGRDYWKRRSLKLEKLLHDRADETVKAVARRYRMAQRVICEQIEHIFDTYARNGALNVDTALQLLSQQETEQCREELRTLWQKASGPVKKELWARLAAPAYAARISRLQALRDQIYAQARMVGLEEVGLVRDRLWDTLEQSYYRTVFDVQQLTGDGFDFAQLDSFQIQAALASDWSGRNWSDRLWDNNQQFADAVEDVVTVGLMSGLRYDEMRDALLGVIGMDSTEGSRYRAARLVRTECAYIANQGHLMGYQAAGIEHYRYLATLDLRTDEECGKLDMQRFRVDEAQPGVNLPPMHPNCRCTTMPDDSDAALAGTGRFAREPVTGQHTSVPASMSYREWYETYVEGNAQAEAKKKNAAVVLLQNAAGKSIIMAKKTSQRGVPNSITQVVAKNGGISRNYYDLNGVWVKQVSDNNHGNPKRHPFGRHGEHAHDIIWKDGAIVDRPARELTEEERKENGDIL